MAKFNYFLSFIFTVLVFIDAEWYLVNPKMFYIALGIVFFINLVISFLFGREKQSDWWKFALLPLLTNIIIFGYSIILTNYFFIQSLIILLSVFNYIYWRYVFYYLYRQNQYTSFSLENLSFYVNFILMFFLSSFLYAVHSLLNINILILGIVALIALFFIIFQFFWISKLDSKKNKIYLIIIILGLMEIFFILSFLPLDYNLIGFILATSYYVGISLINDKLKDRLTKAKIKYTLVLTVVSWIILFLSARWI